MHQPDQTLTVLEVARILKMHKESVRRNIRRGRLRATKISNHYFISRDALSLFVSHYDRRTGRITGEL